MLCDGIIYLVNCFLEIINFGAYIVYVWLDVDRVLLDN